MKEPNTGHASDSLGNDLDIDGVDYGDGDITNCFVLACLYDIYGNDVAACFEDGSRYLTKIDFINIHFDARNNTFST